MLLIIDNYDSFTYNLVQYIQALSCNVIVKRNDAVSVGDVFDLSPTHIVISPGPCTPNEAGISLDVIKANLTREKTIPLLGVCLGHQAIVQACGGDIVRAKKVMHGKTSTLTHDGKGVFADLPSPVTVTRYHSLIASDENVPDSLVVTAKTIENEIMGVRHRALPIEGVQFHPEAILTEKGHKMLNNFINFV